MENKLNQFYKLNEIPNFNEIMGTELVTQNEKIKSLKVNKIEYNTSSSQHYKIIRYDKDTLTRDMESYQGLLRSVIVNSANKVVCFSPPKSTYFDFFTAFYLEIRENVQAEEFVEGTMMNVFWDETIGLGGAWEIATRNCIGGETPLQGTKTSTRFRTMFKEALEFCHLDLNELKKQYCYSFVMQHPENKIVCCISKPALYLIDVFEIVNTCDGTVNVFPLDRELLKSELKNTGVKYPTIYEDWNTLDDLKDKYASMNTNFEVMGVVLRIKKTNMRTKLRNPVYENCKSFKGISYKSQYKYLMLRKQDSVSEYLKLHPQDKQSFSQFRKQLHDFTNQLFKNYIECFIRKEKILSEMPKEYKTHLYFLHRYYVDHLKPAGEYVNKSEVIRYVNNMDTGNLLFALSKPMQERNKKMEDLTQSHFV